MSKKEKPRDPYATLDRHARDTAFLSLANSLFGGKESTLVPPADAADMQNGAEFIPGEVTDARRRGEIVAFTRRANKKGWKMPDGSFINHD